MLVNKDLFLKKIVTQTCAICLTCNHLRLPVVYISEIRGIKYRKIFYVQSSTMLDRLFIRLKMRRSRPTLFLANLTRTRRSAIQANMSI
jgi:hypothetical protein